MKPTLFNSKSRAGGNGHRTTPLDTLVSQIQREANTTGVGFASKAVASGAMSLESLDSNLAHELETSVNGLNASLEQICSQLPGAAELSVAQREAAVTAGIVAGNVEAFLRAPVKHNVVSTESMKYLTPNHGDFQDGRMRVAMEAYDEKENKNAVVYSMAYNMQAARQDEFGEAFYPTVTVTPDQVGFAVSIRLIQVMNEVRRGIAGTLDNFSRRNIIHAVIDPTILRNDQTKIVPVHRTESEDQFVAEALLAPRNVLLEGETIPTSALAVGKNISLLGISQTDALLETGMQDSTDSVDTSVVLEALYLQTPGATAPDRRVVKINTLRLPTATFTHAVQGNYRLMNLAFTSDSLRVNKDTLSVDALAVPAFADIVTGEYSVRLSVRVSGSVNLETSATNVFATEVTVASVTDADGVQLSLTAGAGLAVVTALAGMTVLGYDLDARRTNLNRRQRGQLLDTTFYNQVYAVPLRSPITVPRPLTTGDANDSSDLAALITATHIRTSNAAVEELLRVKDVLAEFVNTADVGTDTPEILGVARFLVKPFYEHKEIDMATAIDSIKSHERAADIQAVLVNQLRDMAYRMFRDSGYKAAADAMAGGVSQVPTVIIGTDPVLARYLTVSGDLRTLGGEFNVKIVSTLNRQMAGKIVMSFGEFGAGKDGVPNPMHFGNMAWKPELTLVLPMHRNGANSKELTVQPAFLHVTNLPIMASVEVLGISDVVASKVAINMTTVP